MIWVVDTCVILDVLDNHPDFAIKRLEEIPEIFVKIGDRGRYSPSS